MAARQITVLVTGSEGYLMGRLVERLKADPRVAKIYGVDIRATTGQEDEKYVYFRTSVVQPLHTIFWPGEVDVVVHGAWQFNPTRNAAAEDELDIVGTENILRFVLANKVGHLVYPGSTTAYAPIPENPSEEPFLREEDWETNKEKRKRADYRYSRNKAIVDEMIQKFAERHPDISIFLMRGAIVVGPNTRNIVSYIARSPFTFGKLMFRVRGYDPPMQFISERDTAEILYRATMDRWRGVYNVAGRGTIRYSEVIRSLGRREAVLPPGVLYPFVGALWRARVFPFPPALLDLVRYPWVADISKLEKLYVPLDTSREAIESFGKAMNRQ